MEPDLHRSLRRAGRVLSAAVLLAFPGIGRAEAGRVQLGQPLATYQGLSATFGEYRPTHLHAGIDLNTGGRNGLKVLAVSDGEVIRVRDTRRGYGRALFIRHPDGAVSIYGHLSAFEDSFGLETMVRARAGGFGRHAGDLILEKPVPVKKGQVIGFSGESGDGLPHLHLEMRDRDNNPLNPFTAGLGCADADAPVLVRLTLDPVDSSSAVNGGKEPVTVTLPQGAGPHPLVRGKIRCRLEAYDRAGAESRLGLYAIEARLDGAPFFGERFDRISFDTWHRIGTVVDPFLSHLSPTVYAYLLFRHPGNSTGTIDFASPLARGALDADALAPGEHHLEITARDAAGNAASASFFFVVNHPPQVTLKYADVSAADGPALLLSVRDQDGRDRLGDISVAVQYSDDKGISWKEGAFTAAVKLSAAPPEDAGSVDYLITGKATGGDVLVRARAGDGHETSPWTVLPAGFGNELPLPGRKDETPPGILTVANRGSYASITVRQPPPLAPGRGPLLEVAEAGSRESQAIFPQWVDGERYEHISVFSPLQPGTWKVRIKGSPSPQAEATYEVRPVSAGAEARVAWDDMEVAFPAGALYEQGYLHRAPSEARNDPYLRAVSRAWHLESTSWPFDKPVTVSLKTTGNTREPARVGLFAFDRFRGQWAFLDKSNGREPGWVSGSVIYFTDYVLLEDTLPPVIGAAHMADGMVMVPLEDRGMGIDEERPIVTLDGSVLASEYDPDRGWVAALLPAKLPSGKHTLIVRAFDRAGNEASPRREEISIP